ncbi:MAG: 3-hydroxyacyl-CoA dehydrogenase NAD-binding domain-containing protein [Pseudomonadota bacterium]
MADLVRYSIRDGVAVLEIDNPPVNTLSQGVRAGLMEGLQRAGQDAAAEAIVVMGRGETFPAGADIREFDAPSAAPHLPDLCDAIEASPKPVVACLHGTALGGGYELALAAHGRIALPGTRVGLPEITLGLVPGAGGTQRLPRLVGIEAALEVLLTGMPVTLSETTKTPFVDGIVDGDLLSAGIAQALRAARDAPLPVRDRREAFADGIAYQDAIAAARVAVANHPTGAARAILDCLEAAPLLPFEAGLALERDLFLELRDTEEAAALRHVFLAVRQAVKPRAGLPPARRVHRVGLLGGGLMGAGVAVACLDAGREVRLVEANAAAAERAVARIGAIYTRAIARGRLTESTRDARLARLGSGTEMGALSNVDLILDCLPEDMALKSRVLAEAARLMAPEAILATNTSYGDIDALAEASGRPEAVVGLHFFAPAHVQSLVEVGVGLETAPEVEAAAFAFAAALGKKPVRVGATEGLIGNRLLSAYRLAADGCLAAGASPYEVDAAMRAYGFAMGPYESYDLSGLDLSAGFRAAYAEVLGARRFDIADLLCQMGHLGQKSGRGFYLYDAPEEPRAGREDPDLADLIAGERERRGYTAGAVSAADIQTACLLAMMNEGGRLLDEGIAERAGDIDVVMLLGFGFPRHKGGPMKAAELSGLLKHLRTLEARAHGDPFWQPAEALREAVKNGNRFSAVL